MVKSGPAITEKAPARASFGDGVEVERRGDEPFIGAIHLGEEIAAIANLAFGLMLGWEAENLRSWSLLRAGFRETGIVQGKDIDEAELKFFMDQPAQFVSPETAALKYRPTPQPDTLGLFGNA